MKVKQFFNNIGKALMTGEIFNERILSRRLYKYFLIGLLIRLIFLPFLYMRDMLSIYQRAAETVFTGNFGSDFHQMLTNLIHSAYLFIVKSVVPAISELSPILLEEDTWLSWVSFNSTYNVFTVVALFKILYLIFDLGCMFLILRLSFDGEPEKRLRVFKYWMFNPIVIFVLYIFARHDIIAVFATIVALLLAKKNRKYWAIAVLAIGIAIRFFPIMLLPLFVLYLARSRKDYVILSLVGVSGLAAVEVFSFLSFGRSLVFSLMNTQFFNYLLWPKLELWPGGHGVIFIFIAAYVVTILSFLHIKKKSFDLLLNYGAIIYLTFLSLCFFHPQYVLWAVPFLVFLFVRRKSLIYYHWFQFALVLILLLYWSPHGNTFMLAAVDYRYFIYLPKANSIIQLFYDDANFVNIFRSIFTGVSLWMIYLIYRDNKMMLGSTLHNREDNRV
jgi:hypothetical protein